MDANKSRETVAPEDQSWQALLTGLFFKSIFVIGGLAIVFESARNSLTWYLAKFWGSAGDNWQHLWDNVLSVVGGRAIWIKMDMGGNSLALTSLSQPKKPCSHCINPPHIKVLQKLHLL